VGRGRENMRGKRKERWSREEQRGRRKRKKKGLRVWGSETRHAPNDRPIPLPRGKKEGNRRPTQQTKGEKGQWEKHRRGRLHTRAGEHRKRSKNNGGKQSKSRYRKALWFSTPGKLKLRGDVRSKKGGVK